MRKAQVFTVDLFNAYSIFLVVMLVISVLIAHVFVSAADTMKYDRMMVAAIGAQDYLCVSGGLAEKPYELDKEAADAFFSQSSEEIGQRLGLQGYNYTIRVVQINGNVLRLEAGEDAIDYDRAVALRRIVRYNNNNCHMEVKLWERGITSQ